MMGLCTNCETRPIENPDTGHCATCAHMFRKAERTQVKEKKPIKKVSASRQVENKEYARLRKEYDNKAKVSLMTPDMKWRTI